MKANRGLKLQFGFLFLLLPLSISPCFCLNKKSLQFSLQALLFILKSELCFFSYRCFFLIITLVMNKIGFT